MPGIRFVMLLVALYCIGPRLTAQESLRITNVVVIGNERTRDHVVLREVPFNPGDSVSFAELESWKADAKQALTNTSLFNFVEVNHTLLDSSSVLIDIRVQERWYIWPGILFSLAETNFNSWWQNRDFERINYGIYIQDLNFRGRREILTFDFQYGWRRKVGLSYRVPGINRSRTLGGAIELYYANNREVNYGSVNNIRLFFKNESFIQEEFRVNTQLEFRPKVFNRHRFNVGLNTVIIADTITRYEDFYLPKDRLRSQYLFLSYGFKREKRDNIGYPLTGYVVDLSIDQEGLGIIQQNDVMISEAYLTYNHHAKLGGRWYYAQGIKGKLTLFNSREVPYYYQRGLGYTNAFIRGYELYVIDGQHYALYKTNLKYNLLKKRTTDLQLGGSSRFDKFHYSLFLNAFADAGYVVDNIHASMNPMANSWQYSAGIGLDFVTYYDIVIRFEGSINKLGTPGFYIHFKNPI